MPVDWVDGCCNKWKRSLAARLTLAIPVSDSIVLSMRIRCSNILRALNDAKIAFRAGSECLKRSLVCNLQLDTYIAIWQYSYMAIDDGTYRLDLAFEALADPTRRAILARLASGDADVSELMKPFALSQPTISKHLAVLEHAGLIVSKRDAQRRPRSLVAVPLMEVAEWIEPFRRFWKGRFNRLDHYLSEVQKKKERNGKRKSR